MYALNNEQPEERWEVEELLNLCFGPGREALSSYRLRDGRDPIAGLCLIARDGEGTLAATVRYWPVMVGEHPSLLLGPIAVHPTRQGEGVGALIVAESLEKARELQWKRVLLVGDAPYFGRLGFSQLKGIEMPPPTNPNRVLGLALAPNAWDGITGKVTPTS